jgi:hypothetical protein
MKQQRDQGGFSSLHVVLVILVLVIVAAAGWFVFANQKSKTTDSTQPKNAITSFDECVAAGNAIMETYPETCAAAGKTFTKSAQSQTTAQDETANWLLYAPDNKAYSIRVPDGWGAISLNGNLFVRDVAKLTYKQGTMATVEMLTEGGWDGPSPFALYNPGSYADQIVREGTEVGTVKTKAGLTAHKYVYTQTTDVDGIGYTKGSKVYNYYFDPEGKNLQISHVVAPGQTDQSQLVEKMLATLTINK